MKSGYIQTDQTLCYDESGKIIPCSGSGQDGFYRSGITWPDPRFEIFADTVADTVKDILTDLMWTKQADLWEFPFSQQEAEDAVKEMNSGAAFGYSDWRIPERHELFSLVSHANINPSLPAGHPFSGIFPGYYWSSTPCARYPAQAWYVHLGGGRVFKGMKHGSYMVWPVRNISDKYTGKRHEHTNERFIENQHTVRDQNTGLIWTRNADIERQPVSWTQALGAVQKMNDYQKYGHQDWRLPNIRELESLTDMTLHSPAISGAHLFYNIKPFYWSSTTSVYAPEYAWTLYTRDGNIGVGFKSNPEFHVWCVRDSC